MYLRFFLVLLLSVAPLAAQDSDLAQKVNQEGGLELTFRNPSEARLVLNGIETGEVAGRKTVVYSVTVDGLPTNKPYILMSWDIGTEAPIIALKDLRLDDKGQLLCGTAESCPGSTAGAEVRLSLSGMLGQPRRFVLTGKDKKPLAMGEVIPFPAKGKSGECTAEAVILRPNAALVLLIGQGFVPGEQVKMESSSRGETVQRDLMVDLRGRVVTAVLPYVKGFDSGETVVTFRGTRCSPSATFKWGPYAEERATAQALDSNK